MWSIKMAYNRLFSLVLCIRVFLYHIITDCWWNLYRQVAAVDIVQVRQKVIWDWLRR